MTNPISEQYRVAGKDWADLDAAARLLEETKTATLSQKKTQLMGASNAKLSEASAERQVKASPEWADFIQKMVAARGAANKKKVELEWLRMRFQEQQSRNANARQEKRLVQFEHHP